ncbi:rRNA pseudouridine synthase [bacterium]|nr:rRNA pseudouridine synthase [bacterium]MCP5462146.1 rRNA pseudouridine synthase [bacterium]
MKQRLHKFLAQCGVASRRRCEQLIIEGKVTVNGEVLTRIGSTIDPKHDKVVCFGKSVEPVSLEYWALHKPQGVICSCKKSGKYRRIIDIISTAESRIYPVGRLDVESEGLIFLTNDGSFCNIITHPRYNIFKAYDVWLDAVLSRDDMRLLQAGIHIDSSYIARPDILKVVPLEAGCMVSLRLNEGRNREIRKLFAELNKKVIRLCRTSIGPVQLGSLSAGQFRKLEQKEISLLFKIASKLQTLGDSNVQ